MSACPSCGTENAGSAKFCSECGTPLAPAERRRKERKFATALFADVVGSTTLAEKEDPEVVQSVGRAFDRLSEEVGRYEGLLARTILVECDARAYLFEVEEAVADR